MTTEEIVNERRAQAISTLNQISALIDDVAMIMADMEETCEDAVFYPDGSKSDLTITAKATAEMERLAQVCINALRYNVYAPV
jgi:hypothetical protein